VCSSDLNKIKKHVAVLHIISGSNHMYTNSKSLLMCLQLSDSVKKTNSLHCITYKLDKWKVAH